MRFRLRAYNDILRAQLARLLARTGVRDVGDASAAKHFLANNARELDRAYYDASLVRDEFNLDSARGDALDARALDFQGLEDEDAHRLTLIRSFGGAQVLWRTAVVGNAIAQAGTTVKTPDGQEYTLVTQAQVDPTSPPLIPGHVIGQDSAPVSVVAKIGGTAGNVAAGAIKLFGSTPAGFDGTQNLAPTNWGRDREDDDPFRARIKAAIRRIGRCTRPAIPAAALKVKLPSGQRVVSAKLLENFDAAGRAVLFIDDGAGTAESVAPPWAGEVLTQGLLGPPPNSAVGGEEILRLLHWPVKIESPISFVSSTRGTLIVGTDVKVSPTDGFLKFSPPLTTGEVITVPAYTSFTGLIQAVQRLVDGDLDVDPANFPGFRAAASQVRVLAPTVIFQRFSGLMTVAVGFVEADVKADAANRLATYYNTLPIGAAVVLAKLIELAMEAPGAEDLVVLWPPGNRPIHDDQVARALITAILVN